MIDENLVKILDDVKNYIQKDDWQYVLEYIDKNTNRADKNKILTFLWRDCDVDFFKNIQTMKDSLFLNMYLPDNIHLRSPLTYIGEQCFSGTNIKNVTMDDSVKNVSAFAFSWCYYLETVKFSDNVQFINRETFQQCEKLHSVQLPKKLYCIGVEAFEGCKSLKHIDLPDNLQVIKKEAFYRCGLEELKIPYSVQTIENDAFSGCPLKTVKIPSKWAFQLEDIGINSDTTKVEFI